MVTPLLDPGLVTKFQAIKAEAHFPTVNLAGARLFSGLHEDQIKDLLDSGQMIGWNISVDPAAPRRCLRVLCHSARIWPSVCEWDHDRIELALYGLPQPFILGTRFYRAWNCDSGHMIDLVRAGVLEEIRGTHWGRGRRGTPQITWESAVAFMNNRQVGVRSLEPKARFT